MPKKIKAIIAVEEIVNKIIVLRGERVMLDHDLAEMYGVETRVLKQSVRRNIDRFPDDFMFELTKKEQDSLRSQTVILKRGQHSKYPPLYIPSAISANSNDRSGRACRGVLWGRSPKGGALSSQSEDG